MKRSGMAADGSTGVVNPLDRIGQLYEHVVRPLQDDLVEAVGGVVDDASEALGGVANEVSGVVRDLADDATAFLGDLGGAAVDVGQAVAEGAGDVVGAVAEEGVGNVLGGIVQGNAEQLQSVLAAMRESPSAGEFLQWLAGPEGPSFEDQTALVPGLQEAIGNVLDRSMENTLVAGAVGKAFGFEYVPGEDFYTTNESSMQSYFGFHDAYDLAGKALGMDLDEEVMEFTTVDGRQYRLELWRGSYGAGGAYGGEIGFYTIGSGERGPMGDLLEMIPGYYSSAAGSDQIGMTQTIYDTRTGEEYFTNDGKGADDGEHYWNLAIRTDPAVSHEHLGQRGELVVDDPAVAVAMHQALLDNGIEATLSADQRTISYDWK